ncbi:MAG: hypothetical protein ABSD38_25365 [Syntrophorhabdales bacterium]|jgi:hypothetical protein
MVADLFFRASLSDVLDGLSVRGKLIDEGPVGTGERRTAAKKLLITEGSPGMLKCAVENHPGINRAKIEGINMNGR